MSGTAPITVVRGDDETLVREAIDGLVADLVGDDDRTLAVAELHEDDYRDGDLLSLGPVVDAASTPPMFTARRVVVARHLGRFSKAADVAPLVGYLEDPVESAAIVAVWERGVNPRQDRLPAIPKSLLAAIDAAGGAVVDSSTGTGKAAGKWLTSRLDASVVDFTSRAKSLVAGTFGEERSRVIGLLDVLEVAFDEGATLDVDDVAPYLGTDGQVPPWELTDAIAAADAAGALDRLHRMIGPGGRHPLQILATLHGHYGRLLRLDGEEVANEKAAAQLLGMKGSTFPAKKALQQTRALGSERIARAIRLLAEADRDLRGATGIGDDVVLDVLVARLAQLHRQ